MTSANQLNKKMKRKAVTQKKKVAKKPALTRNRSLVQERVFLARKSLSSADVKIHLVPVVATAISSPTPLTIPLSDPTILLPGTGSTNQYIGNKINPIGLTVRYTINIADATNTVRVGIFQIDGDATGLTSFDFYTTPTNPLSPIQAYPLRINNTLHDRLYTGAYLAGTYSDGQIMNCVVYIKARNLLPLHFANGGTNISTGAIYLVCLSDSLLVTHPFITAYSELKFLDT